MSYCRFSSNNFACDVYAYESCSGGFVTHVAGNRVLGDVPKVRWDSESTPESLYAEHRAQMDFMETAKRESIGLPHDGESFDDDTPGECADRLESLRAIGYNVPQYAIDALRDEQKEMEEVKS